MSANYHYRHRPQRFIRCSGFCQKPLNVFWSFGIHPSEVNRVKDFNEVKTELGDPIAIGETGLDYHYTKDNRSAQISFCQMLELSDLQLPVIFHVR